MRGLLVLGVIASLAGCKQRPDFSERVPVVRPSTAVVRPGAIQPAPADQPTAASPTAAAPTNVVQTTKVNVEAAQQKEQKRDDKIVEQAK